MEIGDFLYRLAKSKWIQNDNQVYDLENWVEKAMTFKFGEVGFEI